MDSLSITRLEQRSRDLTVSDSKLEKYIQRLINSTNSKNKLKWYKLATDRLNELTLQYNQQCKTLNKETKVSDTTDECVERMMIKLENLRNEIEVSSDFSDMITKYQEYQDLIKKLKKEYEQYVNQFNIVDTSNEMVQPLDLNMVLNYD